MQCDGPGQGRPLGLLYVVMVILRVSYGYGYTRGSGRVGSGSNFRHGSGTGTDKHHWYTGTGRVAEMLDPHTSTRKTKTGTEVAHVTRDSDITFKVKRSTCMGRDHIVAASRTVCL